jgi:hypothetical protein
MSESKLIVDSMDVDAEVQALRDEMKFELDKGLAADSGLLKQIEERVIDIAYSNALRDVYDIRDVIYKWSVSKGMERFPSLLDVCEGNHKEVARLIHRHMEKFTEVGIDISIGMAAGQLNRLAAQHIFNFKKPLS